MTDSRNSGRYLAPALVACAVASGASGAELTIDRLFDAPALAGPSIMGLKISPDGARVTYLKGKADDKDRLDLWEYNIHDGQARVLVDSRVLAPKQENSRTRSLAAASGKELQPCPAFWNIPSPPRAMPCSFP